MNVLVVTNLFPNVAEPSRGTYNYQQVCALSTYCKVTVIAPVPWAPSILSRYYSHCIVPKKEQHQAFTIFHPRYITIPKVFRSFYAFLFAISLYLFVRKTIRSNDIDIIYVPWVYPDGIGSIVIAKMLGKPIVVCALGSDINIAARYFLRRIQISWFLRMADHVIAVSHALAKKIVALGVPQQRTLVLANGVDTSIFHPMSIQSCKELLRLPHDKRIILFLGNLVHVKGIDVLLLAFKNLSRQMDDVILYYVGNGPYQEKLQKQAQQLSINDRVYFVKAQHHSVIPQWINACDVLCLPSRNEGMPNVILEALACEKPIVASDVGGIPEILSVGDKHKLVAPGNDLELTNALREVLCNTFPASITEMRQTSVQSWVENANKLHSLLSAIIKEN